MAKQRKRNQKRRTQKERAHVKHIPKKHGHPMVYTMNDGRPLGSPGDYYLLTIVEGYDCAGFDTAVLDEAMRAVEKEDAGKKCRACGNAIVWENPHLPGYLHESSDNIEGWHICRGCMVEHFCNTDCSACGYGSSSDCRFLDMKQHYMEEN